MKKLAMKQRANHEGGGIVDDIMSSFFGMLCIKMVSRLTSDEKRSIKNIVGHFGHLALGSVCSGTNVAAIGATTLLKALGLPYGKVLVCYDCEHIKYNQHRLDALTTTMNNMRYVSPGSPGCVYEDIRDMSGVRAPCVVHQKNCTIPSHNSGPLLISGGVSCKTLSSLNNNFKDNQNQLTKQKGSVG